ncbi:hypothetical protein [Flavobacterium sp.]
MRFLSIIILSLFLLNLSSCKTSQKVTNEKTLLQIDSTKGVAQKTYLFRNRKLVVSEVNGSLGYTMEDNEKTSVVRFSYEKDMDKAAYDGGYREEVVFEIPNDLVEQNYSDLELQNTKMLFGRYCFCRSKTGLYKVSQGNLHVATSKKGTHFELQFKISEVPQIVTEIKY